MSDAFDEKVLMNDIEGDMEFLEEAVTMFDEDTPALLEQISSAASSGDAAALVKSAHALKGLLGNFCADPAVTSARELEMMAREERLAGVEAAVEKLQSETQRLREALHHFLQAKTK